MVATAAPRGGAEGESAKHIGVNTHTERERDIYTYIYRRICGGFGIREKYIG